MPEDRDDRVLKQTHVLGGFIVPFLLVAFVLLCFFPGTTKDYFAWEIHPDMTPMIMGAGYIAGAYFFARVVMEKQFHRIHLDGRPSAIHITLQSQAIGLALILLAAARDWGSFAPPTSCPMSSSPGSAGCWRACSRSSCTCAGRRRPPRRPRRRRLGRPFRRPSGRAEGRMSDRARHDREGTTGSCRGWRHILDRPQINRWTQESSEIRSQTQDFAPRTQ